MLSRARGGQASENKEPCCPQMCSLKQALWFYNRFTICLCFKTNFRNHWCTKFTKSLGRGDANLRRNVGCKVDNRERGHTHHPCSLTLVHPHSFCLEMQFLVQIHRLALLGVINNFCSGLLSHCFYLFHNLEQLRVVPWVEDKSEFTQNQRGRVI